VFMLSAMHGGYLGSGSLWYDLLRWCELFFPRALKAESL
jgi:hypothetical protein